MRRIRIYVADDHKLLADAVKNLLQPEFEVVGYALEGVQAVKEVCELRPDVVVLDIGMPGLSGLSVAKRIKNALPETRIVFLTMSIDPDKVNEALSLGADGYVLKSAAGSTLIEAIRAAVGGVQYLSPGLQGLVRGQEQPTANLTLEDLVDRALAEIVGGFCHDIGNDLDTCLVNLETSRYAEARKGATTAAVTLRGLHQFVRQYYFEGALNSAAVRESFDTVVREMCTQAIQDSTIAIHVDSTGLTTESSIPSLLLRHLLVPLAHNAAQAISETKRGTGCIWLSCSVETPGNRLLIRMEDNGIGWKGRHEAIELALKSGSPVSTKGTHRGFGLQNVSRLVSRIGGGVALSTSVHGGARVDVWLEVADAKPPRLPAGTQPSKSNRTKASDTLTLRQKEVLRLIAEGRTMKEVGQRLGVSPRTVAFHKYTIMEHLGIKTSAEFMDFALSTIPKAS